ncbi:hypothetical protein [Elstera litoralis]|uniref:hypothetical protein n=1 Tax=Elstera litoralis TaxID=552518 RepID=UPI0012EE1552|nr:hypothetical protein [Elstera litoralis]
MQHPRFHEGFCEAMNGQPFDYEKLNVLSIFEQHRYENGREIAAECRCAGLRIDWLDRQRVPGPLKHFLRVRIAARRCGRGRDPYQRYTNMLDAGCGGPSK